MITSDTYHLLIIYVNVKTKIENNGVEIEHFLEASIIILIIGCELQVRTRSVKYDLIQLSVFV